MDINLASVKWQHAPVYLDDVVVFFKTPEEHLSHVEFLLQLIDNAGMTLKLKKCVFFSDAVDYLGYVMTPKQLPIVTKTRDTVRSSKYPTNASELRSFLGLCNVYRRFVIKFSRKTAAENMRLKKASLLSLSSTTKSDKR